MPDQHALLSASSADRWLHCTRAPRLEETFPERTSEYAEEGRLAHSIAELKLRKKFYPMKLSEFNKKMKGLKADPLYQKEMDGYTDTYVDHVSGVAMSYKAAPFVAIETRLDFSNIAPEGFGTGDCLLIGDGVINIVDFKYGKGVPVTAESNPQMRLYALGALQSFLPIYGSTIKKVHMTIVQPRLDNISTSTLSSEDLINWGVFEVKPKAEIAYKGEGDFSPGDWCRWCSAKAICRARAEAHMEIEQHPKRAPELLENVELGDLLRRAKPFKNWLSDIEDFALSELLCGREVPGWKAVEGRSVRQFSDQDKAIDALKGAGIEEALLYERKPLEITALEKLMNKKEFEELCGGFIIKPPGKPALAPESDNRPAINSAAADFAGINQ